MNITFNITFDGLEDKEKLEIQEDGIYYNGDKKLQLDNFCIDETTRIRTGNIEIYAEPA